MDPPSVVIRMNREGDANRLVFDLDPRLSVALSVREGRHEQMVGNSHGRDGHDFVHFELIRVVWGFEGL